MRWRSSWSPTTSESPPRSSRHRGSRMGPRWYQPHFLGWLDSLGDGAIAVIAHKNGDMDTIASATVLASMIGPRARATGIHVDKTSSRMLARTGDGVREDGCKEAHTQITSGIVAVDAGGPITTGDRSSPVDVPLFIVDHHAKFRPVAGPRHCPRSTASSTCEMVLDILLSRSTRLRSE